MTTPLPARVYTESLPNSPARISSASNLELDARKPLARDLNWGKPLTDEGAQYAHVAVQVPKDF